MPPYLQLLRPANVVTALADILAGYAIAGRHRPDALPWLLAASAALYAGGVVLNDVFDRRVDAVERPERPIPSGRVGAAPAAWLGGVLLAAGVAAAHQAGGAAGPISAALALAVLVYDAAAKRSPAFGPPAMGLCRGLNLLLGMAAAPEALGAHGAIALLPFVYIWAVTALSRQEVHRGNARTAAWAVAGVAGVTAAMAVTALAAGRNAASLATGLILTGAFAGRVLPPFWRAWRLNQPQAARAAVRAGVLSLVVLDAALAATHAGPAYGLIVLVLLGAAAGLARLFAVT